MNQSGGNMNIALLLTLGVLAVIGIVILFSGSSFAGAFLLIASVVIVIFVLLVILISVQVLGIGIPEKTVRTGTDADGIPDEVNVARFEISAVERTVSRIEKESVKASASEITSLCTRINDTVARTPEELGKTLSFYNCLLPAFEASLDRYMDAKEDGKAGEELGDFFDILLPALTKQYRGLFTTERLDLSREIAAIEKYRKEHYR